MARRYFPGENQATLEARLTRLNDEQAHGFIAEVASEGLTSRKEKGLSLDERRRRVLYDLSIVAPATYDPDDYQPVTRTKAVFSTPTFTEED